MTDFNSWTTQLKKGVKSLEQANAFFPNEALPSTPYPILIPHDLASEIGKGESKALANQFLPSEKENSLGGMTDPIGDQVHFSAPQLVHRYKSRALFFPTSRCPVICRYCFRKNELSEPLDIFKSQFEGTLEYLKSHPEINEVIFSGGDPLVLSDDKIDFYLKEFSQIQHIKFIRFHTRAPAVLPQRVTTELLSLLNKYQNEFLEIALVIHINHRDEITNKVREAFSDLGKSRLLLLSQSVLLKGVNDSEVDLKNLIYSLLEFGIRPYYLHHPDQVKGGAHFYLTLEEGRKIYGKLRNKVPGWALPQYVIDIPGGEGKVNAFNPESYDFSGQLINRNGEIIPVRPPDLD